MLPANMLVHRGIERFGDRSSTYAFRRNVIRNIRGADVGSDHAIAPAAKIVLVEASSNSFSDLLNAVDTAVYQGGASVVSMGSG